MIVEWDTSKDEANRRKHGIGFATAILVFDDPGYVTEHDRVVDGETRWHAIGSVLGSRIILVAYTIKEPEESEEVVRIISARKAEPRERRRYAEG